MGASAVLTIGKGMMDYQANKSAERRQREADRMNQHFARINARDAIARGTEASHWAMSDTRRMIGSQRARLAAQGVDVNSGSALDVQADTMALGELDALTIKNNAAREAWGYKTQQLQYSLQSEYDRSMSRARGVGSVLTMGADLFQLYNNQK